MKRLWLILLAGSVTMVLLAVSAATPGGARSAAALVATDTRWPTVTRRATDTRWPTQTRWPTASRTASPTPSGTPATETPAFAPLEATETASLTPLEATETASVTPLQVTETPTPIPPTDTPWGFRPTDTRWPTQTRWPTVTRIPTRTPISGPATSTATALQPTDSTPAVPPTATPTGLRPTDTRWTVRPTDTRWPTVTRRPSATPVGFEQTSTALVIQQTNTPPTASPSATPPGFRPTDTRWPTSTRWPTITRRPTDTRWPTLTSRYSATPSRTRTITRTPTETRQAFVEGPLAIGYSVQGRPLQVWRFGNGPVERMIIAGMHGGGEYNTIQLADLLIAHIQLHPELVPADVTFHILRSLNPDGEARAKNYLGRTNANGVDLNRNWDANWQATWPKTGCWTLTPVSAGSGPGSEPETQAVMAFIRSHHVSALINYHSAALGIFAGGVPDYPPSFRLAEAVAEVTTYPWPPINTGCVYTGGMVDWTAAQGIPSLDLELTDHTHTDFEMNLRVLNVLLNWEK